MVLDYVVTVWENAEPEIYNSEIYTDWANHYLEKARNKRFISDLQQDITDGVLLADVIEAVTNEKVKDIKSKPKNSAQMVENINICLTFLASLGVNVEGLSAKDIKDGNLKSILGLFFSLSRFKQQQKSQQQKQQQQAHHHHHHSDQGKQASHQETASVGESISSAGGRSIPQVNGGEMLSRLPASFKQGNKCPTITNPTTKDSTHFNGNANTNLNNCRNKAQSGASTTSDKVRSHLNQQNNNQQSNSGSTVRNNNTNTREVVSNRATSPSAAPSSIPTPGGKLLGSRGQTAVPEKASSRGSSSANPCTTVSKATSQKASSANKNSMFKFFNSKEKEKIRSGSVKSNSRASSSATSTSSSRSDTDSKSDTKSSASARSSSSMENGTTSGSSSPKPTIKSLTKKGLGRAFNAKRDSAGLSTDDNTSKRSTPSPSPQARTPSPNCTTATRKTSPTSSRKASSKAEKNDQSSPTGSKKGSKIGSLIPKSSTNKTSKSPSLSSVHSNSSSGSQIPTPSSGIPKPTSGKPGKSGKEEKSKGTLGGSRDHNKGVYSQLPGSHKSKSFQHQSIRQQQQPPPPLPDEGQLAQQVLSIPSDNGSAHSREVMEQLKSEEFCSTSRDQTSSPNLRQVAAVQSQSYTGNSSPAMVGKGHVPGKCSSHYVEVTVPAVGYESGRSGKHSQKVNNPEDHIESAVQSINIVKPTRALTPNSAPVAKVDGNTQTNLSALQRPITPVKKLETVKENSGSEIIGENESFSHNRSNAYHFSRNDSFVGQQYDDLINSDKPIGSMNSPRLGVKMLSSQLTKPANNVAIVQPRHGEKIETTFDTEVRTETVNKTSKETYLSDKENKETTFVDDSGETMDIKPMPPIMRAMPYGYFRGYVGSTPNKNFHIPGISVPTSLYAGGGGGSSRLNVNRSYMDHNNFYSGSMKRVMSGGQSALESDYASDIDTYDYISGYMSDGDILRSNRVDDMGSGYLSEGGASLYARRLQQRFREGMQAVKECMQKSSGILDDDSFDDSSSISSGDISDTIAEISTDENLTGSSQCSDHTNPYSSLKRAPKDVARSLANGNLTLNNKRYGGPAGPILASEYRNPADATHLPSGWRKYSLPQNNKIFSDSGDYAYVYSSFDHAHWRKPDGSVGPLRKLSSQSDLGIGLHNSTSFNEADRYSTKRDSETNTDQSCLLEANMRKMQNNRNGGSVNNYGYRRPLSNASSSSVGSNKSSSSKGSVGGRLGKQGDRSSDGSHSSNKSGGYEVSRPACSTKGSMSVSDMGPEAYNSITLERKKKMGGSNGRSSSSAQTDSELYKSNTLGRRKIFGSRSSLSKMSTQSDSMCCSTIISNPHATYSKHDRHGFSGQPHCPQSYSSNYLPLEYSSPRNSGSSNPWLKNSNGNLSSVSGHSPMQMSETESMESISSTASSIQARGLSGARILAHQASHGHHVGLHRSNSIRSTQSECLYSSIHHGLSEDLTRTNSYSHISSPNQPSSPTPSNSSHSLSRFTYPMTAYNPGILSQSYTQNMVRSNTQSSMPYSSLALSKIRKDEDISMHGSSLSLVSTSSSLYSSAEEKQTQEAHVVAAFEQSLSNMTTRLQQLTATAEQKDSELNELRATIEALKRQSGLNIPDPVISPNIGRRHHSQAAAGSEARICRQMSSDSMSSINSLSSACSAASQQSAATDGDIGKKSKKKKGWLRSSFSKAFSRKKNKHGSISDVESDTASLRSNASAPNSPLLQVSHLTNGPSSIKGSHSSGAICEAEDTTTVVELRKQLREKDMKLTDIRLEALSSAHQLEQLRETMNKMRNEMSSLKADNDRLQRMVTSKTWNMSTSSLQHQASNDSLDRSLSLADHGSLGRRNRKTGMKSHAQTDLLIPETPDREGKRVTIMVYLGSNPDPFRTEKPLEVLIGSLSVSGKTKWDILDNIVRKIFKEYVLRIDPVTNLGLSAESVFSYHIGEIVRTKDSEVPELLPIGYLVGETMQIGICLKGTKQNSVDSLAFETQIPKSIIQRYVSLLLEHRRIILCGPSGTGKTYLAQKLAEHLVLRSGKELTAGAVATFSVDHKSGKELRQYLANIAEQCESTSAGELPSVIILDNLHHVGSLGEVFNGFLSVKYQKCPYIIGTMNQATCSTTNLQLHHNFRWVLCANHMEPVKGFLGRYLRRKLVEAEVRMGTRNNDLNKIIDWIPKVWQHLNKFLETHSSSDVTIGPRLFLCCPMDISGSQVWFTDLWNYSIIPYLLEAVREGLQVYGKRAPWEDPADWVIDSYPWANTGNQDWPSLLRLRPEDVGYDTQGVPADSPKTTKSQNNTSEVDGDPLLNMLMRLQEAASYSSPQSNDSDSTSLDSHCSSIQEFSSSSVESML